MLLGIELHNKNEFWWKCSICKLDEMSDLWPDRRRALLRTVILSMKFHLMGLENKTEEAVWSQGCAYAQNLCKEMLILNNANAKQC